MIILGYATCVKYMLPFKAHGSTLKTHLFK